MLYGKEACANMKQLLYWKKFANSGNVLDYLYYKQAEEQNKTVYSDKEQQKKGIEM